MKKTSKRKTSRPSKRTSRPRRNAPSKPTFERAETISGMEVKFFSEVDGEGYKNWSFTINGGPTHRGRMTLLYMAREEAKKAVEALLKRRDRSTGQYVHEGGFERLCVCGHPLGEHSADTRGGKRPCFHDDFHAPGRGPYDGESCDCERFRPSRKKVEPNALTSDKDLQKIIRAAEKEGWTVEVTGGGHLVFKSTDRGVPPIYTAKTPSDPRALKNIRSTLKRHGLVANVFPEDAHPAAASGGPAGVLVERMPDGEWRWEVGSTTGYESTEREAHDAARRTVERRRALRSM